MASIFDYTGDARRKPPSTWATKLGRIFAVVFDTDKGTQPTVDLRDPGVDSSTIMADPHSNYTSLPNMWKVLNERKSIYMDIHRMLDEDEYVATALDIISDFACAFDPDGKTMRVDCDNKEAQAIIDALIERLNLHTLLAQLIKGMVLDGNEMREVIVDRSVMQVVGLKQTISYYIWPNQTEKGEKLPGWLQMSEKDLATGSGGQLLEEWQICPFQYGYQRGLLAVPLLAAARRNWSRLSKIEDGMAIARLTRAYDRLVHKVPVANGWSRDEIMATIRRYKDSITRRKLVSGEGKMTQSDSPADVETDYYLPDTGDQRGSVEVLNSTNLQLGNLNDIYYSRERLISRLRVPIAFMQISSSQKTHLKSGSVGDADIQFAKFIRGIHANLRLGLRRLIDLELILNGFMPKTVPYTVQLAEVQTDNLLDNAKIELTMAQAAAYFVEAFGALPIDLLADKFFDLDKDQQVLMKKFVDASGDKILKARLDMLVSPGGQQYKGVPGGGGGTGETTRGAKRKAASSQKQDVQVVYLDEAKALMLSLHQGVNEAMREAGMDTDAVDDAFNAAVEQDLMDRAITFQQDIN